MKSTIILLLLLPATLLARKFPYSFDAIAGYYGDAFDVEWTMPEGTVDLNTRESLTIRQGYRLVSPSAPVLRYEDGECVLMYYRSPLFVSDEWAEFYEDAKNMARKKGEQNPYAIGPARNNDNTHRILMSSELGTVYGYRDEIARPLPGKPFPLDEYIDVLPEKTTRKWFNADSVFVYDLPVDDPFMGIYNHCTGVVITKKGRTGFALKLYLTDEGKKNEKRYLQSLRKTIWYRDTDWKYDRENDKRAIRKHLEGASE